MLLELGADDVMVGDAGAREDLGLGIVGKIFVEDVVEGGVGIFSPARMGDAVLGLEVSEAAAVVGGVERAEGVLLQELLVVNVGVEVAGDDHADDSVGVAVFNFLYFS